MLCDACDHLWCIPRTTQAGQWSGVRPSLFEEVFLTKELWAGAHHTEEGSFLSAVRKKCYICNTIFRDFAPELREQASLAHTFFRLHLLNNQDDAQEEGDCYELDFTIEMRSCELPIESQRVYECTGRFKVLPQSKITDFPGPLSLTKETFTDACERQVRQWLESCARSHSMCNTDGRTNSGTPARLLNISQNGHFHLQTVDGDIPCPPYVTLSHCWEAMMPIKLLSDTQEELQHGMSVSRLPKRFAEAIQIARWMEIKYIWIDALCIMQDSKEDWLHQSARMGDIYTKSYCNIAATQAGSDRGCFTSRVTTMVKPYAVRNPRAADGAETHFIGYDDFWSNSLLDSHVHNRGWVLQERLLSPRTIHFGQEQIFWECREKLACEAYPHQIPAHFCNHRTRAWRKFDAMLKLEHEQSRWQSFLKYMANYLRPITPAIKLPRFHDAYRVWSTTVERYMECRLSVSEDKLVAISGIAQRVASVTNDRYLAGLWDTTDLPSALLWYVLRRRRADGMTSIRSDPYRAPSWSWASLEAQVIWPWPVTYDTTLIDVVHARVEELHGNSMGAISSAVLRIQGKLIEVELSIPKRSTDGFVDEDGSYELRLNNKNSQRSESSPGQTAVKSIEPVIYLDTPLPSQSFSMQTYLLPVCTGWKGRPGNLVTCLAGLLLLELELKPEPELASVVHSDELPAYRRIGIFGLDKAQAEQVCNMPIEAIKRRKGPSTSDWQKSITLV